ncbi:MAG: hypothetical protein ABII00_13335, partial [Elusimicrobiota bacterium]
MKKQLSLILSSVLVGSPFADAAAQIKAIGTPVVRTSPGGTLPMPMLNIPVPAANPQLSPMPSASLAPLPTMNLVPPALSKSAPGFSAARGLNAAAEQGGKAETRGVSEAAPSAEQAAASGQALFDGGKAQAAALDLPDPNGTLEPIELGRKERSPARPVVTAPARTGKKAATRSAAKAEPTDRKGLARALSVIAIQGGLAAVLAAQLAAG